MSEPRDELAGAFHRLRGEIRDRVPAPPAARLRARAIHRLRVRRATTAVVAAAAVVAIAGGGNALLRPTAGPPVPPADPPGPSATPPPAPPTVEPSLERLPPPAFTPSPRPSPAEPEPLDDPIAQVDWGRATITVPPRDGCPTGPVQLTPVSDSFPNGIGPADGFPKLTLDATGTAYGDLTGDSRAEAVVAAGCAVGEEALTSGHDASRLLVVAHQDDGTLTGLAWVGPAGAAYHSWWLVGDRLLIDADPGTAGPEEWFETVPGLALAYQWDGSGFSEWQPASDYPPILPLDPDQTAPPIRPRAVGAGLHCADQELRFARVGDDRIGAETEAGDSYTVSEPPLQQSLFDLDRTGQRLLVVALSCTRAGGGTQTGLAVFERAGDGWRGISVLLPPPGDEPVRWWMDRDRFHVEWLGPGLQPQQAFRWTGTMLEPTSG